MSNTLTRRAFLKGTAAIAGTTLLPTCAFAESAAVETEEETPVAAGDMPSAVIDRFVTRPGEGEAFLAYFTQKHAESFPDCGLTNPRTLVFPPVWLKDSSNEIDIIWDFHGSNAFWGVYNSSTRFDPETIAFWKDINSRVESHDRLFCGDAEKLEAMNHV